MANNIMMNNDYILRKSKVVNKPTTAVNNNQVQNAKRTKSFEEILNNIDHSGEVKFSKHALNRLESRNITLTDSDIKKINEAVKKADSKGVQEALIMMDNKVFIASVKNKTIITASVEDQLKDNIFTNIDGAVIV